MEQRLSFVTLAVRDVGAARAIGDGPAALTLARNVADPDGYRWENAWNPGPLGHEVLTQGREVDA